MILFTFTLIYLIVRSVSALLFKNRKNTIIIATKNFSEQYILGNIMADIIELRTKLAIKKEFNLGSTAVFFRIPY